jgi:2-iminobutanoate/2-iminopropanoate deaminase
MSFHRNVVQSEVSDLYQELGIPSAVHAGPLLFISGQAATDATGEVTHRGDVQGQARVALERIQEIVRNAGGSMDDVVDILASFLDVREADAVLEVAKEYFRSDYPAWTLIGIHGFRQRGARVQLRAVAHLGKGKKRCFLPESLRWWRGKPVSGACRKGPYLFVSGQLPVDLDGNVVNSGDHAGQARYLFHRMNDLVQLAGGKLEEDALDLISFSIDPRSFGPMCDIKNREFLTMPFSQAPCSSILAGAGLYKPLAFHTVRVFCEIGNGKAVAYTPSSLFWRYLPVSGGTKKEKGHLLCIAGEVSMDMDGQIVAPGDPITQARYAFSRIREVVELAGGTMDNIVDILSFHKDPRAIESVMMVGREYFSAPGPAWTAMGYTGGYFEGHLHEICARAWLP